LYKLTSSSFTVRCRRCTSNRRPSWFNSTGTEISTSCDSGVCTENTNDGQLRFKDLMFPSFAESLEGEYRCSRNRDGVINIKVLG